MSDKDIISKAVELADGWEWSERDNDRCFSRHFGEPGSLEYKHDFVAFHFDCKEDVKFGLDALAAQLVRQVDAIADFRVDSFFDYVEVAQRGRSLGRCGGPDRTMNTLRAIVESGVLDKLREVSDE